MHMLALSLPTRRMGDCDIKDKRERFFAEDRRRFHVRGIVKRGKLLSLCIL